MGSLLQSCKDFEIRLDVDEARRRAQCNLIAQCQKLDGTWRHGTFDLNLLLDNHRGKFVLAKREAGFSLSAFDTKVETVPAETDAEGKQKPGKVLLKAALNDGSGHLNNDEIDLEALLANMNGILSTKFNYEVNARQEQDCQELLKNARNIRLEYDPLPEGPGVIVWPGRSAMSVGGKPHVLVAELKNQDGSWVERRVDLDAKLGNRDGYLVRTDQGFSKTCQNIQLSFWDSKKQRINKDGQPLVLKPSYDPNRDPTNEDIGYDLDDWVIKPTNWSGPDYNGPWDPPSQPYPPSTPVTVCLECTAWALTRPSRPNRLLLSALFAAVNGQFEEAKTPVMIGIPETKSEDAAKELDKTLKENPGAWVEWADDPDKEGMTLNYVFLGDREHGPSSFFRTTTLEARASIQHYVQDQHVSRFQHVAFDALTAEAHGTIGPYYAGVGASLNIMQAEASIFDLTLGLGVESGIGVVDETAELEFLGCGIMIGRKVGISVFGTSFDINLGRLFGF